MADLSKLSNEELMRLTPQTANAAASVDLSHLSNEELMKLQPGAKVAPAADTSGAADVAYGSAKGASNIGSTIMAPVDKLTDMVMGDRGKTITSLVTGKQAPGRNEERRATLDGFFDQRADTKGLPFKAGELATEIAGTAGVGGVLAKGATLAGETIPIVRQFAPKLAAALESGGFRLGAPEATTAGGKVADLATRVGAGAVTGAVSSGLVDPNNTLTGAALGGALPVAAKIAGAAGNAIAPKVSEEVRALYEKAKNLGIDIPVDRIVNSKPLNALAASLNYVPLSGRAGTEQKMVSQLNRAVSRTFGQDSDNVTGALRKAQTDLGNKFEVTLKGNAVKADDELVTDLVSNLEKAGAELKHGEAKIIGNQVDGLIGMVRADGTIDGQAAYNIKKTLDRIGDRNSNEAYYAREIKKSLMAALNRSLGPEEAAAFAKVRQQYGNMLDLEHMAPNGAEGEITAGKIANLRNLRDPALQDLADIAAQFIKTREGPHGAMQRVTLGAIGAAAGTSAPAAAPAIAGGIAVGRAANTALNFKALKNLVLGNGVRERVTQGNALPALRALVYDEPSLSGPSARQ